MKFYGAGWSTYGKLGDAQKAHRTNVAHRVSKSARQVDKLRDKASETIVRHALGTVEFGYPVGTLVDYRGTYNTWCNGTLFKITDRYFSGPDQCSNGSWRYVLQDVDSTLELRGVREESISIHVE
jgi:hypothetical protein